MLVLLQFQVKQPYHSLCVCYPPRYFDLAFDRDGVLSRGRSQGFWSSSPAMRLPSLSILRSYIFLDERKYKDLARTRINASRKKRMQEKKRAPPSRKAEKASRHNGKNHTHNLSHTHILIVGGAKVPTHRTPCQANVGSHLVLNCWRSQSEPETARSSGCESLPREENCCRLLMKTQSVWGRGGISYTIARQVTTLAI